MFLLSLFLVDSLSLIYTAKLHDAYEKVCSNCLDEMENVKVTFCLKAVIENINFSKN